MAGNNQWILCLVLLFSSAAICEDSKDLDEAEANGKLEIIKQIKKINDDGSYTIGYEADDGSFKIESRDVLGNIKGTYGYIDEEGEIKRVSYSSTNTTEVFDKPEAPSVVQRIPKVLKSNNSTTRRPIIVYPNLTTQSTPSSTNVIQAIPRRRIVTSATTTTTSTPAPEKSPYEEYLKPLLEHSRISPAKSNNPLFSTVAPARILVQSRPLLRSTASNNSPSNNLSSNNSSVNIAGQLKTTKTDSTLSRPEAPQIVRPEVPSRTTDSPVYRRFPIKNTLLDSETSSAKPVTEEPEVKSNLLRRQLNPDRAPFDPRQHAINLQQAVGHDSVDVYSASLTTGTPRPLFTTTSRPKILSSTTIAPLRPTVRYQPYQRPPIREQRPAVHKDIQETTTGASVEVPKYTTPSSGPVVQIPANRDDQDQFVAVRHPFHRGTILVPVSHFHPREQSQQLQGHPVPVQHIQGQQFQSQHIPSQQIHSQHIQNQQIRDQLIQNQQIQNQQIQNQQIQNQQIQNQQLQGQHIQGHPIPLHHLQGQLPVQQDPREFQPQYLVTKEQYLRELQPSAAPIQDNPQPIFVRRMPHQLRPMPVHVDENGFIREVPAQLVQPTPYPIGIPIGVLADVSGAPRQIPNDVQTDIDQIKPPVSTKDFQKLLEQLIIRQSRLEQISMLSRHPELIRPRFRPIYPQQIPIVIRRPETQTNGPVQFLQSVPPGSRERQFVSLNQVGQSLNQVAQPQQHHPVIVRAPQQENIYIHDQNYQHQELFTPTPESFTPMKRVARLLNPKSEQNNDQRRQTDERQNGQESENEEFLPPDVREMLLLRMLQLAINPALPLDESEMELVAKSPSSIVQQGKKEAVRNVQILGEEDDTKKANRIKRYKDFDGSYD